MASTNIKRLLAALGRAPEQELLSLVDSYALSTEQLSLPKRIGALEDANDPLEARDDAWAARRALAESALALDLAAPARSTWLGRASVAAFWQNDLDAAERHAASARALPGANPAALVRVLLVSGYLMDVRGQHARAEAWYRQALSRAPPEEQSRVLLEIATSLSKQGRYAESLAAFADAEAKMNPSTDQRILIHVLSRRAVVHEILGDVVHAEALQRRALERATDLDASALAFTIHCRLLRTYLASGDLDRAYDALTQAEAHVAGARRGRLFLHSDWARYWRRREDWNRALASYNAAVVELPADANDIVDGYADGWIEILDGVEECFRRLDLDKNATIVAETRRELRSLREPGGIYDDQATTTSEARRRVVDATDRVRRVILDEKPLTFTSQGYRFDLRARTATPLVGDTKSVALGEAANLLLLLHAAPKQQATKAEILDRLRADEHPGLTWDAVRQRVRELRRKLRLRDDALLKGTRGRGKGGYALELSDGGH